MLVKTGDSKQMEYQDKCIRTAIACISNLGTEPIPGLLSISKQYYADILADISIFTKVSLFALDNYSNINGGILASMLQNEKMVFNKESINTSNISIIQNTVKNLTQSVSNVQASITSMYGIDNSELSIFSYDEQYQGINFRGDEDNSPLMFKYYEGKLALKSITDLLRIFTEIKQTYAQASKSISLLSVDKAKDILMYFHNTLQVMEASLGEIEFIIDSTDVADVSITKLLLTNEKYYNSFLNRNYDTIKKEIIDNYFV